MNSLIEEMKTLFPCFDLYRKKYAGQKIVIKYGGHAMDHAQLSKDFARDMIILKQLGMHPIIVHGGGPQIETILNSMDMRSYFKYGLRVTTKPIADVAKMVLAGSVNKDIVSLIQQQGGRAVGISGIDDSIVVAEKFLKKINNNGENGEFEEIDLGYVGHPVKTNVELIDLLITGGFTPVIAPISAGRDGCIYNVNADIFAGAIAASLRAKRLLFLTNVAGVLDQDKILLRKLAIAEAENYIKNGVISGGMIPKVETCIEVLKKGVQGVVIFNDKEERAILRELFTDEGVGTLII